MKFKDLINITAIDTKAIIKKATHDRVNPIIYKSDSMLGKYSVYDDKLNIVMDQYGDNEINSQWVEDDTLHILLKRS